MPVTHFRLQHGFDEDQKGTQNDPGFARGIESARDCLSPNYRPAPIVFERGEGPWLYDTAGRRYLDFAAGIAVCALGHGHPAMTKALSEQARNLLHVSNLYLNRPSIELAEFLTSISFADRVYFANSGAEANEAALKLARRYMQAVRGEDRQTFICATQSFTANLGSYQCDWPTQVSQRLWSSCAGFSACSC